MTRVLGLAGWSGAGKTTLLAKLIPVLNARGYSVSTLKHAHHMFDIDKPGKDSYLHREAGAREVLVASGARWALMHELRDEDEPRLADLLGHMSPVDFILVEGFKRDKHVKMEIHRRDNTKPWLYPDDSSIGAIISDADVNAGDGAGALAAGSSPTTLPRAHLDDMEGIANLVVDLAWPLDETLRVLRPAA
jgi:molybdopterin-guanine dinucleotide biosynthesis protein B